MKWLVLVFILDNCILTSVLFTDSCFGCIGNRINIQLYQQFSIRKTHKSLIVITSLWTNTNKGSVLFSFWNSSNITKLSEIINTVKPPKCPQSWKKKKNINNNKQFRDFVQKTFNSRISFSIMTYFNKYLIIYRYSRNGTFLFFLQIAHISVQAKNICHYLYSCKIFYASDLEIKKEHINFFLMLKRELHTLIMIISKWRGALCANTW